MYHLYHLPVLPIPLSVLSFPCGMDRTIPWTYTHVPLHSAVLPSHVGWTGQSRGHTHIYHCTRQSCLSYPSHVGRTGQSRGIQKLESRILTSLRISGYFTQSMSTSQHFERRILVSLASSCLGVAIVRQTRQP